jgi:hypothetical protein
MCIGPLYRELGMCGGGERRRVRELEQAQARLDAEADG